MKKILIAIIILSVQSAAFASSYIEKQLKETTKNQKYNTVQKHKRNYQTAPKLPEIKNPNLELKDPKLINLGNFPPVDEEAYQTKLAEDEKIYKSKIIPSIAGKTKSTTVDFYNIYRVTERLIRANNLDYMNWRVAIRKTPDEFNAASTSANFIWINSALYDSLSGNDDALAFVIAHEMSHHILGHHQRQAELYKKLMKKKNLVYTSQNNDLISGILSVSINGTLVLQAKNIYKEMQMMEFMADSEALILLTKAGYSTEQAMATLNFMDALPNVEYWDSTHPIAKERIKSTNENALYINPEWANAGKANILNSDVLPCKKSSDRVSIILSKSKTAKNFYEVENLEQRLTRIAYMSYKQGNMNNAIKYFYRLSKFSDNYIPYLYISYANEYLYKQFNSDKHLNRAINSIEKAKKLNPNDINVQNQIKDLESLNTL